MLLELVICILFLPYMFFMSDLTGEITAVKSTVADPPQDKNRVMGRDVNLRVRA